MPSGFITPKTFANDSVSYPDMKQKYLSSAAAPKPLVASMPLYKQADDRQKYGGSMTNQPAQGMSGMSSLLQAPPGQGQINPQMMALMQMLMKWLGRR